MLNIVWDMADANIAKRVFDSREVVFKAGLVNVVRVRHDELLQPASLFFDAGEQ